LRQYKNEIEARKTHVALISFGNTELAKAWIEETQASFQFLLDSGRKAYQAFSLDYSMARSWSPKVWLEYARLMAKGRRWRGVGILRMAYRSHDPTDRPAVDYLLNRLDQINGYHAQEAKTLENLNQ
jgi:hypothetical protein